MPSSSNKAVIFDLGGVLVDWNPEYLYRKLIPDAAARQFFLTKVCTPEWHERHDAGVSFADNAKGLLEQYKNDPAMCELITAWGKRFNEMYAGPIEGTVDILAELHAQKTPLYALTNWPAEAFPEARRRFHFFNYFSEIIISGQEHITKPNRRIYEILVARTGIDPAISVYIDDHKENLSPAAALGMHVIHFTTPSALRAELRRLQILKPLMDKAS